MKINQYNSRVVSGGTTSSPTHTVMKGNQMDKNPFDVCPVCLTIKSIMVEAKEFRCSRCDSTLSFEEYNKKPIDGIVMEII